MKNFIKGVVLVILIEPVLDCMVKIIGQSTEYLCTKIAVKTYGLQKELQEEPQAETNIIGFHVPNSEEYYEEEEE